MVEGNPPHDLFGFLRSEHLLERLSVVCIEIIQYEVDAFCFPISREIRNPPDLASKVRFPSALCCASGAISRFGLHGYEYVCGAIPDVFVISTSDLARESGSCIPPQFLALLIETQNGLSWIVWLPVEIKHVLHPLNEVGGEGWDHPHFFPATA